MRQVMDGGTIASDFGPFGRPLFNDPAVKKLERVGVIDVGSNSVRMVVFDGAARSPAYFFNEKVMCGLGAGMGETGHLSPIGRARALAAIRRFVALAEGMDIPPMSAVATAAVRNASDGEDFCREIAKLTGLGVYIIDGEEEARLSAQGVLLGWPNPKGLVCDIGGSSMELAYLDRGQVGVRATSSLGPLRLKTLKGGAKARKAEIDRILDQLAETIPPHKQLFLVGGSWRAIAKLDMLRKGYPLQVLHDYVMKPKSVRDTLKWLARQDMQAVRLEARLSGDRIALVPEAGEVLRRLIRRFGVKELRVSAFGIREGMLYEQMPDALKARDPLIEACRFEERRRARVPGFGRTMYKFVRPLFPRAGERLKRLMQAACLLHDVAWRAHPDYRGEISFDNTTRGNLGGIDHQGRVFLGLALLHRYRSALPGNRLEPLLDLLSEAEMRDAEILGRAMRLGSMFSGSVPETMGALHVSRKHGLLTLRLPAEGALLYGEVAEARLASLARAMDLDAKVHRGR